MSQEHVPEAAAATQQHPQGVQPLGSRLMSSNSAAGGNVRNAGLGTLAPLDDALLLGVLGLLRAPDLARLAVTSRAMYCFAYHEPLWKALALQELEDFSYSTSWRETYISGSVQQGFKQATPLQVSNFYSDVLYLPWHFAHAPLEADWLEHDNIPRRDVLHLTLQRFQEDFEAPNRPVIITGEASSWAAMHKWTHAHFRKAFAGRLLNAGGMLLSYDNYLKYSADSRDELPLYLFDKHCLGWKQNSSAHSLVSEYQVPHYFAEDLFSVLGEQRPDYRWLIIGPTKAGSSFHKDPNSTSAWNAIISGSKKWVLWPPSSPPPGVHPSADGLDVSTPYTLHEWFDSFHAYAREDPDMLEGVCRAGEVLFVPRGWWHLAINLEDTVAITQNYVSAANLPHVLHHLENPVLVSGCSVVERATLHDRFVGALQQQKPEVLERMTEAQAAKKRKAAEQARLSSLFVAAAPAEERTESVHMPSKRHRAGDAAAPINSGSDASSAGGFSFGFAISGA